MPTTVRARARGLQVKADVGKQTKTSSSTSMRASVIKKVSPDEQYQPTSILSYATPHRTDSSPSSQRKPVSQKQKHLEVIPSTPAKRKVIDLTNSSPNSASKKRKQDSPQEEKRLKRFRTQAPQSCLERIHRAQTQRMIVLKRVRNGTEEHPIEDIDVVGSTGNIYTVTIDRVPSCTCPDNAKGNQCKHIYYALTTVLKAPHHLQYQLAFLTSELREIFSQAPAIPNISADENSSTNSNRKPTDGECPICYMDLEPEEQELVWCKAACGNNVHKSCFDQWTASQKGQTVKCVYCRTPWQPEVGDSEHIKNNGEVTEDGYVNVADQFGIDRGRDYSSYYQPWARRQFGPGW